MIPILVAVGVFLVGVIVLLAFQWRLPKDSGFGCECEDCDRGLPVGTADLEALYQLPAADRDGAE